jgi:hypothetical protein
VVKFAELVALIVLVDVDVDVSMVGMPLASVDRFASWKVVPFAQIEDMEEAE